MVANLNIFRKSGENIKNTPVTESGRATVLFGILPGWEQFSLLLYYLLLGPVVRQAGDETREPLGSLTCLCCDLRVGCRARAGGLAVSDPVPFPWWTVSEGVAMRCCCCGCGGEEFIPRR